MSDNKIKIGITHGDANGIGYEVIVKSLCDPRICELCTPVVYGSAKAAGFYKKQIEGAENLGFNRPPRPIRNASTWSIAAPTNCASSRAR